MFRTQQVCLTGIALAAGLAIGTTAGGQVNAPARVVVDMDLSSPGFQTNMNIRPNTTRVSGVGVFIIGSSPAQQIVGIGYIGGLDRGIAFGHAPPLPSNPNQGVVIDIGATTVAPVMPGGTPLADEGGFMPTFAGPEVQYIEFGGNQPVSLPMNPALPVFSVEIDVTNLRIGDRFEFFVQDAVSIWRGEGGAFCTTGPFSFDTGGDVTPDGTRGLFGVDLDHPALVPPAAFAVDYIDGPNSGGGATLTVIPCEADYNADGAISPQDIFAFLAGFFANAPAADINGDGVVSPQDVFEFLTHFFGGC